MASYAFTIPVKPGKVGAWKKYIAEMTGPRKADLKASRKGAGLTKEKVWLQSTPMGDYAVVYWEAADISNVFKQFLTSTDPFDKWFREKILMEIHAMDPAAPPPPMNESILDA